MNILITAIHPVGGIRTYFRYVFAQSCFNDCQFTFIAPDDGLSEFIHDHFPEKNVNIIPINSNKDFIKTIRREIKSGRYDFVHSHGFSAGMLTQLAQLFTGATHLMTAHDVFTKFQFQGFKGKVTQFLTNRILSQIDCIHTVTMDADKNLQEFCPSILPKRLRLIVHGIDVQRFAKANKRQVKSEINIEESTALVGFFGRFMGQKGFRILVDAINIIKNQNLLSPVPQVVTFGWGGFIREDYEYLADKGLSEYFTQLPNTDDVPAAIKGVDIVAMPSRWEACGLLGMEVLCCGVPMVGTNCIGLREVLEDSPASTVDVNDAQALALAIVEYIKPEHLTAAHHYVEQAVERFDVKISAQKMKKLYFEINRKSISL
jgi:glycosyltransferase involved in cell wall biosynthesis